jgi:hypothetical protein
MKFIIPSLSHQMHPTDPGIRFFSPRVLSFFPFSSAAKEVEEAPSLARPSVRPALFSRAFLAQIVASISLSLFPIQSGQ